MSEYSYDEDYPDPHWLLERSFDTFHDGFEHLLQKQYTLAVEQLERSLCLLVEAQEIQGDEWPITMSVHQAKLKQCLARAHSEVDNRQRAISLLEEAVADYRSLPNQELALSTCLNTMGVNYHLEGDLLNAKLCYDEALLLDQTFGTRAYGDPVILNNLADVASELGEDTLAINHLLNSVASTVFTTLEAASSNGDWSDEVDGVGSSYRAVSTLIEWFYERNGPGDLVRALAVTDLLRDLRLRSRLLQAIREADPEEWDSICEMLINFVYEPTGYQANALTKLHADELLLVYRQVSKKLYGWAIWGETVLMYQVEGDSREVFNLALEASNHYRIPPITRYIAKASICEKDEQESALAPISELVERAERARQELSRRLFGPMPPELWTDVRRVRVVPDGDLFFAPFELLTIEGILVNSRIEVSYSTSPLSDLLRSALSKAKGSTSNWEYEFVGFGDPQNDPKLIDVPRLEGRVRAGTGALPGAAWELEVIARSLAPGSAAFFGSEGTKERIVAYAANARWVHFATHGFYSGPNEALSCSILIGSSVAGKGGTELLTARDIFGLTIPAEVVVCSACVSGMGVPNHVQGMVGLSQAFLFAGAKCVVVALWPVDDLRTSVLMQLFYE